MLLAAFDTVDDTVLVGKALLAVSDTHVCMAPDQCTEHPIVRGGDISLVSVVSILCGGSIAVVSV